MHNAEDLNSIRHNLVLNNVRCPRDDEFACARYVSRTPSRGKQLKRLDSVEYTINDNGRAARAILRDESPKSYQVSLRGQ